MTTANEALLGLDALCVEDVLDVRDDNLTVTLDGESLEFPEPCVGTASSPTAMLVDKRNRFLPDIKLEALLRAEPAFEKANKHNRILDAVNVETECWVGVGRAAVMVVSKPPKPKLILDEDKHFPVIRP